MLRTLCCAMTPRHGTLRLLCAALVLLTALEGCGSRTSPSRIELERPLLGEYKGWSTRVTPSFSYATNRWHAQVDVWPPDRRPESHSGVRVHFGDTAWDRSAIEQAATAAARRYIDASMAVHQ